MSVLRYQSSVMGDVLAPVWGARIEGAGSTSSMSVACAKLLRVTAGVTLSPAVAGTSTLSPAVAGTSSTLSPVVAGTTLTLGGNIDSNPLLEGV